MRKRNKSVFVIELGDPGRKLRMVNHAISLAREDFDVRLLCCSDAKCHLDNEVGLEKNVRVTNTFTFPAVFNFFLPKFVASVLKLIWDSFILIFCLPLISSPDFLLLQNPPALPALPICYFYTLIHPGTRLVLDWHNYDHIVLALSLGPSHPFVVLTRWIEDWIGSRVKSAFCVSKAMKKDLEERLGVLATVLYDRPSNDFRPISVEERHTLFEDVICSDDIRNVFTQATPDGDVTLCQTRPGLLVSSTSWTEEENFSVLFDALSIYETECRSRKRTLPDLVCIISGRGPLRDHYCDLIAETNWSHVAIFTVWLQPEHYPKLLASADLGVSLHASPSGYDLPMKVVEMFGCGLPVAAKSCPALHELVINGINGMIFETSQELANQICSWFEDFPSVHYERRRRPFFIILDKFRSDSWPQHWRSVALPLFKLNDDDEHDSDRSKRF